MDRSKVTVKSAIRNIERDRVFFVDDTSICVDIIILCTGYLKDLSFLDRSCRLREHDGRIIEPLFKGYINILEPSMCFIGDAEVFVKHLHGLVQLPDRVAMLMSLDAEIAQKEREGVPDSHYFYLTDVEGYFESLSDLGQVKPLPPVIHKICRRNVMRLLQPIKRFLTFEIIDDENFVVCWEGDSPPSEQI